MVVFAYAAIPFLRSRRVDAEAVAVTAKVFGPLQMSTINARDGVASL